MITEALRTGCAVFLNRHGLALPTGFSPRGVDRYSSGSVVAVFTCLLVLVKKNTLLVLTCAFGVNVFY